MGNNILFNLMNNMTSQQNPQLMQMIQSFNSFKQQYSPAQAEQKVKELLMNGQMSQSQFENLKQMALQFSNFFR